MSKSARKLNRAPVPPMKQQVDKLIQTTEGLTQAAQITAEAVNRLETFVFSLVKYIKDKDGLDLQLLGAYMEELMECESLEGYWDREITVKDPENAVETEETTDEVATEA